MWIPFFCLHVHHEPILHQSTLRVTFFWVVCVSILCCVVSRALDTNGDLIFSTATTTIKLACYPSGWVRSDHVNLSACPLHRRGSSSSYLVTTTATLSDTEYGNIKTPTTITPTDDTVTAKTLLYRLLTVVASLVPYRWSYSSS